MIAEADGVPTATAPMIADGAPPALALRKGAAAQSALQARRIALRCDHDVRETTTTPNCSAAAIGPVRRLREAAPPPSAPKPRPRARMAERDEAAARDEFRHALDAPIAGSGRRPFLSPRRRCRRACLQRLRRGEIAIQDELDLHGADMREAEMLLRAFIAHARDHGFGCVRIIHGKGLHGKRPDREPRRAGAEKPGGSPAASARRRPRLPLRAARTGRHRSGVGAARAPSTALHPEPGGAGTPCSGFLTSRLGHLFGGLPRRVHPDHFDSTTAGPRARRNRYRLRHCP